MHERDWRDERIAALSARLAAREADLKELDEQLSECRKARTEDLELACLLQAAVEAQAALLAYVPK